MSKRRKITLWPLHFDVKRSRGKGRRVPLKLAVEKPSVEEISDVLHAMGYKAVVEEEKRHPSTWHGEGGRVLVETDAKKGELLKKIAKNLRHRRAEA